MQILKTKNFLHHFIFFALMLFVQLSHAAKRCEKVFSLKDLSVEFSKESFQKPMDDNNRETVPKYNTLKFYKKLKAGDLFKIENQEFRFEKILGTGGTTIVIDIGEGKVLRVPYYDPNTSLSRVSEFITDYLILQQELEAAGIRVPRLYQAESLPPYFLVVEKINIQFTLRTFFSPKLKITPFVYTEALQALYDFAKSTWMYANIGDFKASQLGYDGKQWVLFDFAIYGSSIHRPLNAFESKENTFLPIVQEDPDSIAIYTQDIVPKEIAENITELINKKRNKQQEKFLWFTRLPAQTTEYHRFHLI